MGADHGPAHADGNTLATHKHISNTLTTPIMVQRMQMAVDRHNAEIGLKGNVANPAGARPVCVCVCVCVCIYVNIYIYIYIHIYTCMYIYICYVYVCAYI
jgi:hypothetical protein